MKGYKTHCFPLLTCQALVFSNILVTCMTWTNTLVIGSERGHKEVNQKDRMGAPWHYICSKNWPYLLLYMQWGTDLDFNKWVCSIDNCSVALISVTGLMPAFKGSLGNKPCSLLHVVMKSSS